MGLPAPAAVSGTTTSEAFSFIFSTAVSMWTSKPASSSASATSTLTRSVLPAPTLAPLMPSTFTVPPVARYQSFRWRQYLVLVPATHSVRWYWPARSVR